MVGGEVAEVGHTQDEQHRLGRLRDLAPVVAIVGGLGVDLEGGVRERVRRKVGARLPDGQRVQDVVARRDDLGEVVGLEVCNQRLNLVNGTLVVAVEETVEVGELVDEFGI